MSALRVQQPSVYTLSFHYSIVASVPKLGGLSRTMPANPADLLKAWNNKGDIVKREWWRLVPACTCGQYGKRGTQDFLKINAIHCTMLR